LTEAARRQAVGPILAHITAGDSSDAVLLAADFNAPPSAPSRRQFGEAGLADSAALAGQPTGTRTFHLYGIPLRGIDGVLVNGHWRVRQHAVLKSKPGNVFPSDHFGVLADLHLQD
jgi:endonuclease/exonuclease/phosphatase family metal-dependent hydrolase